MIMTGRDQKDVGKRNSLGRRRYVVKPLDAGLFLAKSMPLALMGKKHSPLQYLSATVNGT